MQCKHVFAFWGVILASIAGFSAAPPLQQASSSLSGSPISLVQSAKLEGSGVSSLSQAFSSPNTAGNLIIAFVRMSTTSQTVQVTDSLGNTYTDAVSQVQDDDGHQIHILYAANIQAGVNTVTANFSATNNHPWLAIFEYNGVAIANPLDVTSSAQGSSGVASSGNTAQSRTAKELVFAAVGLPSSSSVAVTAGSGFVIESQDANSPGSRATVEDQISTTAGSVSGMFSLSGSANWTSAVATFIAAQLAINTTALSKAVQGMAYTASLNATGGGPPYTWSISSGSLPAGLSLSSTGVISGTPSSPGSYSFTVQVADAEGNSATQSLMLQVDSASTGPITLVQSASIAGNGVSSLSQAFPSANTAGNLIIAFVRMSTTSQTVQVTDTQGNIYTDAVSQVQSDDGHQTHIFYAPNVAPGANTVTATFSALNNHPWLAIYEYSGLDPTTPLDKTAHAQGSGASANSGTTQQTSSALELVFGGVGLPASSTQTLAADTGFTLLQQDAPPDNSRAANEQAIVSSAGQYFASFTLSAITNWTALVATFQAPAPPRAQLAASPASLEFGSIASGTSTTQSITITNTGTASASITGITENGTGFSVTGLTLPYSLAPNATATIQVSFAPVSTGTFSGTVSVASDASNSPLNVSLSGTATPPPQGQITANSSSVNFGNVNIGSTSSQAVVLTNSGNASTSITQVGVSGNGYSLTAVATPYTLAPGATLTVNVNFAPTAATGYSGMMSVTSDASNPTLSIPLSGTGTQPPQAQLSANPSAVNFGGVPAGGSSTQSLSLTNTGTATASITQITTTGSAFAVGTISLPYSLAVGATVSLQITFSPGLAGVYSGSAVITSNASNSPLTVSLSGTATHWVALTWTDADADIVGYNVYRGSQSGGPYNKINGSLIAAKTWNDNNVQPGQSYYYVVTAVNASGIESAYSAEASGLIPTP